MRSSALLGVAGALMFALPITAAKAECGPGAIGTSRQVEIDTTGGPAFGQVHSGSRDILQPGEVALTFDDGPHKKLTPVILDILDQHCAKATFFMLGERAMMYPDLVREVERRGHSIGTHTWSHANLQKKSGSAMEAEIELGISGVQKALGKPAAPFFRFPYLATPRNAIAHLQQRNTGIFSIDIDSKDYRTRSPTVVMRNVMSQTKARGRGIILFHDIQPSTAGALGALLSDLKAGGYRVVHLVPKQNQTTIAAYDQRVGTPSHVVAGSVTPVSRRTVVAPAWEPRAVPHHPAPNVATVAHIPAQPIAKPAPQAPPRPFADPDWRTKAFQGW
ncbi:MAG: polysaccharide deacetylase family protein [Hyphomicrobiaceae bacterium]